MNNRIIRIFVIIVSLVIAGCMVVPISPQNPSSSPSQPGKTDSSSPPAGDFNVSGKEMEYSRRTFDLVNGYRKQKGLPELVWHDAIAEQCFQHSRDMALGKVPFGHNNFDVRAANISKVLPWAAVGENVAMNQGYSDPPKMALEGWIRSTGHRQNMEGKYNFSGMGVVFRKDGTLFFTQIFVRAR